MRDGRSKPPSMPDEYEYETICAALNRYFGGALYRPEQIPDLPQVWLDKMLILLNQ